MIIDDFIKRLPAFACLVLFSIAQPVLAAEVQTSLHCGMNADFSIYGLGQGEAHYTTNHIVHYGQAFFDENFIIIESSWHTPNSEYCTSGISHFCSRYSGTDVNQSWFLSRKTGSDFLLERSSTTRYSGGSSDYTNLPLDCVIDKENKDWWRHASGGSGTLFVSAADFSSLMFSLTAPEGSSVSIAFYSYDRNQIWPAPHQHWTMYGGSHDYRLSCQIGEKICYAAWDSNGSWGVNMNKSRSCMNCCEICASEERRFEMHLQRR